MKISRTSKLIIRNALLLSLAELVMGVIALYFFEPSLILGYVLGLFIGSVITVVNVVSLERTALKIFELDSKGAKSKYMVSYVLRFGLSVAAMVIVALNHPAINVFSTFFGLINERFGAYLCKFQIENEGMDIQIPKEDEERQPE